MSSLNRAVRRHINPQPEEFMSSITDTLQQYTFFSAAADGLKEEIITAASPIAIPKGTYLFQKGEEIQSVGFVGAGDIRVYMIGDTGREVTLYHVGPGQTCPINLLCTLLNHGALADAFIETDFEGVVIPAREFRTWAQTDTAVCHFVFNALATRMIDVLARVDAVTFQKIDQRLAVYLLARFAQSADNATSIQVTHEQIASEIGTAREVVTRVLKGFEHSGAVKLGHGQIDPQNTQLLDKIGNS